MTDTKDVAEILKEVYQRHLLAEAQRRIVFGQFGTGYHIPGGHGGYSYSEADVEGWYRKRVARLRYNVTRNHRKPSKGKPLRLIPEVEEY